MAHLALAAAINAGGGGGGSPFNLPNKYIHTAQSKFKRQVNYSLRLSQHEYIAATS